jgi:hypothetical protein
VLNDDSRDEFEAMPRVPVRNYATGGAVIIHYPVQDGTG